MRRARHQVPLERQQELLSAFLDAYSATETRVVVDRFLLALFRARREPGRQTGRRDLPL